MAELAIDFGEIFVALRESVHRSRWGLDRVETPLLLRDVLVEVLHHVREILVEVVSGR